MVRAALFTMILGMAAAGIAGSMAQDDQPPQNREGERRRERMMGPPPSSSMVVCKDYIFILQGPTLYKVDPNEMKVVGELQMQKPRGEQPKDKDGGERDKDK